MAILTVTCVSSPKDYAGRLGNGICINEMPCLEQTLPPPPTGSVPLNLLMTGDGWRHQAQRF